MSLIFPGVFPSKECPYGHSSYNHMNRPNSSYIKCSGPLYLWIPPEDLKVREQVYYCEAHSQFTSKWTKLSLDETSVYEIIHG